MRKNYDKSQFASKGMLGIALSFSEDCFEMDEVIVSQYDINKNSVIATIGKENVITAHENYLDSKLFFMSHNHSQKSIFI